MSTKQQNIVKRKNQKRSMLLLTGVVLLVGWTIVLGATPWLETLPCALSPRACADGAGLVQLILFAPLVIGSVLIPVVIFSRPKEKDFPRPVKLLAGVAIAAVLLFISSWAIIFIGISTHGIGG